MSALWSPRSLSRTQPPLKRKTKRSSSDFSLSISCAASTKRLRRTASSGERVRVGILVRITEDAIVWRFFEIFFWGGGGCGDGDCGSSGSVRNESFFSSSDRVHTRGHGERVRAPAIDTTGSEEERWKSELGLTNNSCPHFCRQRINL